MLLSEVAGHAIPKITNTTLCILVLDTRYI